MNAPELNAGVAVICWHRLNERQDQDPAKQVLTLDEARRVLQPTNEMEWMANAGYHAIYEAAGKGFEVRVDGVTRATGRTMGELRQALKEFKTATTTKPAEAPPEATQEDL